MLLPNYRVRCDRCGRSSRNALGEYTRPDGHEGLIYPRPHLDHVSFDLCDDCAQAEPIPMTKLPDREPWIARAIIGCLRQWQRDAGPGGLYLTPEDIDHLEAWAADLDREHRQIQATFERDHIPWTTYPVRIQATPRQPIDGLSDGTSE